MADDTKSEVAKRRQVSPTFPLNTSVVASRLWNERLGLASQASNCRRFATVKMFKRNKSRQTKLPDICRRLPPPPNERIWA
jgi:hypothetical protein